MYILNHGKLDVFIDDKRIAGLEDGAVFGEISLLEVAGGNRRTADVSDFHLKFLVLKFCVIEGDFSRIFNVIYSA
jgi:hypothetical protein